MIGTQSTARNAFQTFPALDHAGSLITAIALDQQGQRLFLGLSTGYIEEHRIGVGNSGIKASVVAKKNVSKKV